MQHVEKTKINTERQYNIHASWRLTNDVLFFTQEYNVIFL